MRTHVVFRRINQLLSFKNSKASDPISAFGGVVACNFKINLKIASEINKTFFEVIMAKGSEKKALKLMKKKRICELSIFQKLNTIIN